MIDDEYAGIAAMVGSMDDDAFGDMVEEPDAMDKLEPERRFGTFCIAREMIDHEPDTVRSVMGMCIIVRCEFIWAMGYFEYTASSPQFDVTPRGTTPAKYDVVCNRYIDGEVNYIEFKRKG